MQYSVITRGVWSTPEIYGSVKGLPVIKSLRTITAGCIQERIESLGPQVVFSIGIGDGVLYKQCLRQYLVEGALTLIGIDSSAEMLQACMEDFPVSPRISHSPTKDLNTHNAVLVQQSVLQDFGLRKGSVGVVEAGLVLHHIEYRMQLEYIASRVYTILERGGLYIIADIDVDVGAYIEAKEAELRKKYQDVRRDIISGNFICSNDRNATLSIPILDPKRDSDLRIITNLMTATCEPLRKEARLYGNPTIWRAIEQNIQSAIKGGELHRPISEWVDIVWNGFNGKCEIEVIDSAHIKRTFPEVLDKPFVLLARKR